MNVIASLRALGRPFLLMWAGQTVSMVGSAISGFAFGVWIFQGSGKVLDFAGMAVTRQRSARRWSRSRSWAAPRPPRRGRRGLGRCRRWSPRGEICAPMAAGALMAYIGLPGVVCGRVPGRQGFRACVVCPGFDGRHPRLLDRHRQGARPGADVRDMRQRLSCGFPSCIDERPAAQPGSVRARCDMKHSCTAPQ